MQVPTGREVEELVVGDAAPEEERQPRREFQVTDTIRRARRQPGRLPFDAEEKLAAHQDSAQRRLDSRIKTRLTPRVAIELQYALEVRVADRSPIGPAHQRRKNLL